jgi:phosphoribosylamine-glycine ligase
MPGSRRSPNARAGHPERPAVVVRFCEENAVDFVVIGPEAPLAAGVADALRAAGILAFGPSAAAARLEASKAFTKEVCDACGAPTAAWARFTDPAAGARPTSARRARRSSSRPTGWPRARAWWSPP